jgi:nitroreductase
MHRNPKVPEMEELAATACAVQNMYLTATAYGIGCYWGTGGITYLQEARAFFNLGENDNLLGFFHVGMLKSDDWPEGKRGSIKEKVAWVEVD